MTLPDRSIRLRAIGEAPQFVPAEPGTTADRLLGAALGPLTELMDRRWHEQILPAWRVRYVRVQQGRMRLDELNARHESGAALSRNELLERAMLTESVGGDPEAGLAQLRRMLAAAPDDALLCLAVGARLVARDDTEGVALIERAMELNEDAVLEGAQLLRDYHWRQGQQEAARAWHERAAESAQIEQGIKEERSRISLSDTFEDHGLPNATVGELRTQLQAIAGLRAAYLVRKRVSKRPDRPCYVLGFTVGGTFRLHSKARAAEVQARMLDSVPLPEGTVVFNAEGDNRRFQRRFRRMRGARVV